MEKINYKNIIKEKYPDAVLDYTYFNGNIAYYIDMTINNTGFESDYYENCTKEHVWEEVYNILKQKDLI